MPIDRRVRLAVAALALAGSAVAATGAAAAGPAPTAVAAHSDTASSPVSSYSTRGPHVVGYREFRIRGAQGNRLKVRAWYPTAAPAGAARPIRYAQANKFDEATLPVERITATGRAVRDGRIDRRHGEYPLVVFSHGYALSPIVYSTLVEHYASHGFVVLAPEHDERLEDTLSGFWKAIVDRPADVTATIDLAERLDGPRAAFAGRIDLSRVAVVGHSYGGYTALAAAGARFDLSAYNARCAALAGDDPLQFFCAPIVPREAEMAERAGLPSLPTDLWPSLGDPRVTAAISLAGDAYLFDQRGMAELKVPLMVMGGTVDDGTPYEWGAKLSYDHAGSARTSLVTFDGAGHMLFVDPCDNLPWVDRFSYRDAFCTDAVWGSTRPLDIVEHYSTAFLLDTLKDDRTARAVLAASPAHEGTVDYTSTGRRA